MSGTSSNIALLQHWAYPTKKWQTQLSYSPWSTALTGIPNPIYHQEHQTHPTSHYQSTNHTVIAFPLPAYTRIQFIGKHHEYGYQKLLLAPLVSTNMVYLPPTYETTASVLGVKCAIAMHLTGVRHYIIKKMECWSTDTLLIYIHEKISAFSEGISKQMAHDTFNSFSFLITSLSNQHMVWRYSPTPQLNSHQQIPIKQKCLSHIVLNTKHRSQHKYQPLLLRQPWQQTCIDFLTKCDLSSWDDTLSPLHAHHDLDSWIFPSTNLMVSWRMLSLLSSYKQSILWLFLAI